MPIAFKEWAVTVRALAEGEQLLTLRKGGIREPGKHFALDGGIAQPDRVRIRAWAEVAGAWTITDRRAVDALSPFHVWTTDYAEKRLCWKRRHPLHVLLLRTYRIPRPVTVRVRDDYGGGGAGGR